LLQLLDPGEIAMALNGYGGEKRGPQGRDVPPITVPRLAVLEQPVSDDADERKEIAARFTEARIVRQGQEALETVNRAASFSGWLCIGKALLVLRRRALQETGAERPLGRVYSAALSRLVKAHNFDRIAAPTRSVAIELAEHGDQITAWRNSLPARRRKRLVHPLSVTRRWRAAIGQNTSLRSRDLKWEAQTAWARLVACARALPPELARPLWEAGAAEAAAALAR
jgi:hypothetical protein